MAKGDKIKAVGSRAEVMHGTAEHTSGYLYKDDLMYNSNGRIVSKVKHELGKKLYKKYKDVLQANEFTRRKSRSRRKSPSKSRRRRSSSPRRRRSPCKRGWYKSSKTKRCRKSGAKYKDGRV